MKHKAMKPLSKLLLLVLFVWTANLAFAGVDKATQERYKQRYENKALFLKIPVRGEKQIVFVGAGAARTDTQAGEIVRFKVGDQVRVLNVSFGGDEIRFKIGPIDLGRSSELVFKFSGPLQEGFAEADFNAALNNTFTEGLSYTDIDRAKQKYLQDQFDRIISELAATSNTSRDFVLRAVTERLPAYVSARRDVQNVEQRNSELQSQLGQLNARLKRVESEQKQLQSENDKLNNLIDAIRSELGVSEGTGDPSVGIRRLKQQLADVKKALNLKVESSKDLGRQIQELSSVSRRLQQDKATVDAELKQLKDNYEKSQDEVKKLTRENTDLKSEAEKLSRDLKALNLKGDSLSKNYLQLQKEKDKLQDSLAAFRALRAENLQERVEDGYVKRVTEVRLNSTPIGSIESTVPAEIKPGDRKNVKVTYTAESIDYLKLSDADRKIMNSIGERLKIGQVISNVAEGVEVKPVGSSDNVKEVRERSSGSWEWEVVNQTSHDPGFVLQTYLLNKDNQEIPLLSYRVQARSPDLAKKIAGYLQPIPVIFGALCGFILFGIVGAFRRAARPSVRTAYKKAKGEEDYVADKQL